MTGHCDGLLVVCLCAFCFRGEAPHGFAAGRRRTGPHTCSTQSIISSCSYSQACPLHGAGLLSPAPVVLDRSQHL